MNIETKRLILRDYLETDWRDIHEYAKDPDFSKYDAWGPNSEADTKNFVNERVKQALTNPRYEFEFAAVDRTTFKVIGGVGLRRQSELSSIGSLGYAINPQFQNQGLASEATKALLNFGFETLQLKVIWATSDMLNPASFKVMEKNGIKKVGHLFKHKEFKGEWHDSFRYEITLQEFLNK